ncbi:MAG: hypothetical protein V1806_15970 [Pseudomonadota bacterium]
MPGQRPGQVGAQQQGNTRGQLNTGRRQPPTPPAPPVQINATTKVAANPTSGGYTATRKNNDGSRTVVSTSTLPNGQKVVSGHKVFVDPAQGRTTRVYNDGRRVEITKNAVTSYTPDHRSRTIHNNGLREERWRDGRRMYHDEFHNRRRHDGRTERIIKRTIVATLAAGALVALAAPLIQEFAVEPVNGVETYPYIPAYLDPPVYEVVSAPLPAPVMVASGCEVCPPPVVVYQQPMVSYSDPAVLLGDLQIAGAINDGMAAYPPAGPGTPAASDADVQALASEVASLQQEVSSASANNEALKAQLAQQQAQTADLQAQVSAQQNRPVEIPEEVRQQIRQQVMDDIALHKQQRQLTIRDVMASAQAQNYIFQVSGMIEATDLESNEPCVLTTGDLIRFQEVPGQGEVAAQMMVVTSKSPTVRAGSVVLIGLTDLQEMLNSFSQRLEANMQKVARYEAGPRR